MGRQVLKNGERSPDDSPRQKVVLNAPARLRNGDLPIGTECATLARFTAKELNGLTVQSASGATEKELRLVAAVAMFAWPS